MKYLWAFLLLSPSAWGLEAELGIFYGSYANDDSNTQFITEDPAIQLKIGTEAFYLWGSYETPKISAFGQNFHDNLDMLGYGIGARHSWNKFRAFIDFGVFDPNVTVNPFVRVEVVNRTLLNHHGERGKHGVSPTNWFQNTSYTLDKGYGARLGGTLRITEHVHVVVSYRWFNGPLNIDGWNGDEQIPGPDWWQERGTLKYNALEVGIVLRFGADESLRKLTAIFKSL